ncbi:C6 transcription factor [Apiospora arundinis]|uniref:C6 transcription factor n=1 Tax=Apiospora arundinis TaxID=335852 RepID=A0ABR2JKL8_9PEZI
MAKNQPDGQSRHMRRILPAPALTKRPPSPPPQQPPPKSRAPNVAAACEECRRHKCRCSGERPTCRRCLKRSIHCRYREIVTSETLKQSNHDLRDRGHANEEILQLLKNLPDQEAHDVLARLRSGASVSTIVNQVKAGDLLLQLAVAPETRFRYEFPYRSEMPSEFVVDNKYLNSTLYKATSLYTSAPPGHNAAVSDPEAGPAEHQSLYVRPFHAAQMVDPLLSDARPSLWTAVCDDDVLMRDLLAIWFRCEYQFTSACQKDYFLEDMVAKRQDFCSSLLVNIILAYACVCYPRFSNRAEYWNPHTLLYRFLAEAKRLWELEAAEPRLTTIQAGIFFNVFHNLCGLDEIGQAYRIHAINLANELGFYDGPIKAPNEKLRHGRIYTAWALYSWEALVGFSFMIPPLLKQPPHDELPDPLENAQWYGEIWLKYPSSQVLTPAYFGYGFKAKCDFRLIMNDFCHAAYSTGSGGSVSLDEANKLRTRLLKWYNGLSKPLRPETIVLPAQLQLHMYYHTLLLSIYEPLLEAKAGQEPSPQTIVAEANRYMQTLIRLYYLRHGFESMDLFIVIPLVNTGFHCIDDINGEATTPQQLEVLRSTLILIAKGLHSQRANHYLAEALFRVVRGRMRLQEASLLKTSLHFDEGEEDRKSAMVQTVRSHWPVTVVKKKEDLDNHILGNLVESYAHLNVEDGSEGDPPAGSGDSVSSAGITEKT